MASSASIATDVVIIGAGVGGLAMAYAIAKSDPNCTIDIVDESRPSLSDLLSVDFDSGKVGCPKSLNSLGLLESPMGGLSPSHLASSAHPLGSNSPNCDAFGVSIDELSACDSNMIGTSVDIVKANNRKRIDVANMARESAASLRSQRRDVDSERPNNNKENVTPHDLLDSDSSYHAIAPVGRHTVANPLSFRSRDSVPGAQNVPISQKMSQNDLPTRKSGNIKSEVSSIHPPVGVLGVGSGVLEGTGPLFGANLDSELSFMPPNDPNDPPTTPLEEDLTSFEAISVDSNSENLDIVRRRKSNGLEVSPKRDISPNVHNLKLKITLSDTQKVLFERHLPSKGYILTSDTLQKMDIMGISESEIADLGGEMGLLGLCGVNCGGVGEVSQTASPQGPQENSAIAKLGHFWDKMSQNVLKTPQFGGLSGLWGAPDVPKTPTAPLQLPSDTPFTTTPPTTSRAPKDPCPRVVPEWKLELLFEKRLEECPNVNIHRRMRVIGAHNGVVTVVPRSSKRGPNATNVSCSDLDDGASSTLSMSSSIIRPLHRAGYTLPQSCFTSSAHPLTVSHEPNVGEELSESDVSAVHNSPPSMDVDSPVTPFFIYASVVIGADGSDSLIRSHIGAVIAKNQTFNAVESESANLAREGAVMDQTSYSHKSAVADDNTINNSSAGRVYRVSKSANVQTKRSEGFEDLKTSKHVTLDNLECYNVDPLDTTYTHHSIDFTLFDRQGAKANAKARGELMDVHSLISEGQGQWKVGVYNINNETITSFGNGYFRFDDVAPNQSSITKSESAQKNNKKTSNGQKPTELQINVSHTGSYACKNRVFPLSSDEWKRRIKSRMTVIYSRFYEKVLNSDGVLSSDSIGIYVHQRRSHIFTPFVAQSAFAMDSGVRYMVVGSALRKGHPLSSLSVNDSISDAVAVGYRVGRLTSNISVSVESPSFQLNGLTGMDQAVDAALKERIACSYNKIKELQLILKSGFSPDSARLNNNMKTNEVSFTSIHLHRRVKRMARMTYWAPSKVNPILTKPMVVIRRGTNVGKNTSISKNAIKDESKGLNDSLYVESSLPRSLTQSRRGAADPSSAPLSSFSFVSETPAALNFIDQLTNLTPSTRKRNQVLQNPSMSPYIDECTSVLLNFINYRPFMVLIINLSISEKELRTLVRLTQRFKFISKAVVINDLTHHPLSIVPSLTSIGLQQMSQKNELLSHNHSSRTIMTRQFSQKSSQTPPQMSQKSSQTPPQMSQTNGDIVINGLMSGRFKAPLPSVNLIRKSIDRSVSPPPGRDGRISKRSDVVVRPVVPPLHNLPIRKGNESNTTRQTDPTTHSPLSRTVSRRHGGDAVCLLVSKVAKYAEYIAFASSQAPNGLLAELKEMCCCGENVDARVLLFSSDGDVLVNCPISTPHLEESIDMNTVLRG